MNPQRRAWLLSLPLMAAARAEPVADTVRRGRALVFPRDHGAHLAQRIEWWYATGWLRGGTGDALFGFQLTFFRSRTGLAEGLRSRFAARHILFAHAAVSDIAAQRHLHADRMARWAGGDTPELRARASLADTNIALNGWTFARGSTASTAHIATERFSIDLQLQASQPVLLQGHAGFSRKGPGEAQASHYYSEPQLAASGRIGVGGQQQPVRGQAWLDHEWSDELLHPQAVGWDWIGFNFDDGSALTAFRLRRADGSGLWAGGSFRPAGGAVQAFAPDAVQFTPGRRWRSPATNADYPVEWRVDTPAGRFDVRALMDAQELDSRASTGTAYWEGLSELRSAPGQRVGLGYLEMTGYAGVLRL